MVVGHKARPHYADHGALFEMEVRVLAKRDFRIEMYNPPEGVLWEAQVYLTTLYENVYMRRGICIQNGVQVQATDKEVTYGEWNNLYGKFTVKTTVPAGDFRNDSQRATPIQYFDPNDNKWKKGRCLYHPDSSIIGCKGEDKSEWEDDFVGLCSPDLYKIFS